MRLLATLAIAIMVGGCSDEGKTVATPNHMTWAERFPGEWNLDPPGAVLVTLGSNKIRDCGIVEVRASIRVEGEYLAYCSNDNKAWKPYVVRTTTQEVLGPYAIDPALPPKPFP